MQHIKWLLWIGTAVLVVGFASSPEQGDVGEIRTKAVVQADMPVTSLLPVVGQEQRIKVWQRTALLQIARRYGVDRKTLARLNHCKGESVRSGMTLLLPTVSILPAQIDNGIVLNIPERGAYVFRRGKLLARYPTAVGRPNWQTPVGRFYIAQKVLSPTWLPPEVMVRREGTKVALIPPGPKNPLGDRWMGWNDSQVGFHTTWSVTSIGMAASHGCVRLYPEAGHRMFDQVYEGMPILALYEPFKLGRQGDTVYLSVSPDLYHKRPVSVAAIVKKLETLGLSQGVDRRKLAKILAAEDGYPHAIATLSPSFLQRERAFRNRDSGLAKYSEEPPVLHRELE